MSQCAEHVQLLLHEAREDRDTEAALMQEEMAVRRDSQNAAFNNVFLGFCGPASACCLSQQEIIPSIVLSFSSSSFFLKISLFLIKVVFCYVCVMSTYLLASLLSYDSSLAL